MLGATGSLAAQIASLLFCRPRSVKEPSRFPVENTDSSETRTGGERRVLKQRHAVISRWRKLKGTVFRHL
jgi:hypothetical protein